MDNKIIQISNNKSSLYSRFMANAITASPNVQKNFLEVTKSVAETIQEILDKQAFLQPKYSPNYYESGTSEYKKNTIKRTTDMSINLLNKQLQFLLLRQIYQA